MTIASSAAAAECTSLEAIIVGGGPSGIAAACRLQKDLSLDKFLLFEKGSNFGGTWLHNRYPGAGCDIPTRLYSFSFAQRKNWNRFFSLQPEIEKYLQDVAQHFDVDKHAQMNTEVRSAEWIPERSHWRVKVHGAEGEQTFTSRILVSCVGSLSIPKDCDIPGHKTFTGQLFHSAKWPEGVDLTNKKVVIIGNGCSAAQIVPSIAPQVKQLTQIARSKHWIVPQLANPLENSFGQFLERWIPGFIHLERIIIILLCESHFLQVFKQDGQSARERFARLSRTYITRAAPRELVPFLLPSEEEVQVACKRRIFDGNPGYIPSLNRKNVELTSDAITEIVRDGVLLKSGRKVEADVIILATGFKTGGEQPMDIINGEGMTLQAYWNSLNGVPQAHLGTLCSAFPNLALIWGPNTVTGHFSAIASIEMSIDLMMTVFKPLFSVPSDNLLAKATNGPLQRSEGRSVHVKLEVEEKEQIFIQETMKDYIFTTGCGSWYTDPMTGRVTTLAPTFQTVMAVRTSCPQFGNYVYRGLSKSDAWKAWTLRERLTSLLALGHIPDLRSDTEAERGFLHRLLRAILLIPAYQLFSFAAIHLLRSVSFILDSVTPWKLPASK